MPKSTGEVGAAEVPGSRFGWLGAALAVDYALQDQFGAGRDDAGKVRAAQIGALSRFSRAVMVANVINGAILFLSLVGTPQADVATLWTFALICLTLFIYLRSRAHSGRSTYSRIASRRGIRHAIFNAFVLGLLWGAVPVLFFDSIQSAQIVVICLAIGMLCAGCFVLAPVPLAALAFVIPIAIGAEFALLRRGDFAYNLIGVLTFTYALVLMAAACTHAQQFIARVLAQSDAERRATLDSLTQLANRTALLPALDEAVERCRRFGESFALFSIDLDGFKTINDRLGHPAGDALLIRVAARLASAVRGNDLLARIGGDEFSILARGVQTPEEAADIAERLLALFAIPVAIAGEDVRTGLSVGIALSPSDGLVAQTLLERADTALYEAKNSGRNAFRLFRAKDDLVIRRKRSWTLDLRKAIARKEMHLEFQPILALGADRIRGFEALLRWTHPIYGRIPPAEFIPVAETSDLIRPIGDFVIDEACRAAAQWPDNIRVAVNFSLDQFRSLAVVDTIERAVERHGLARHRFEIEMTESILFQGEPVVLQTLEALHRSGLRLVLDDFGTGFSSLHHLQDLPIDGVKIDRAFICNLPGNLRSKAIVRAVIDLCRELDICVTAEGVETPEQVATLRALGCDEAQGFWIGRPSDGVSDVLRQAAPRPRRLVA